MTGRRRVVITGIGVLTSIGKTKGEYWEALSEGRSGVKRITMFDTSRFPVHIGSEVRDFDSSRWVSEREAKRMDRFALMGMVATGMAVEDSGLDFSKADVFRVAVIIGSGVGGLAEFEEQYSRLKERGPDRVSPLFIPKLMMNSAPGYISMKYGLKGPNYSVASACASANHAIGLAFKTIQYGDCDIAITGGVEASLVPSGLAGFCALGALSKRNAEPEKASRPFDKERDGFVLGEGAGILILEELEQARRRGAHIYCEVVGFGQTADAYHITAPEPSGDGAAWAMKLALMDGRINPDRVSYINAHGTSTELNDKIETLAIKKALGEANARRVAISSTKSMIGHLLGAAGAVELIATVLCMENGVVHPTINYEVPDDECDLDYVPNVARELDIDIAISNSFGFGGHNATIAVGKLK